MAANAPFSPLPPFHDVEQCYLRYGPMVHRRCLQLLGTEDWAADALQDVFVQLMRYRAGWTGDAPASLLNRIATNVCLNLLRGSRVRGEAQDEGSEETLLSAIAKTSDLESYVGVRSFLARLFQREPASTQTLAVLHYVDGMTLEEVAREVGLSVSGVRRRLRVLREKLPAFSEIPIP